MLKVEEQDAQIRALQRQLKEAESLLATTIYQVTGICVTIRFSPFQVGHFLLKSSRLSHSYKFWSNPIFFFTEAILNCLFFRISVLCDRETWINSFRFISFRSVLQ
jgi:hypothetical protein